VKAFLAVLPAIFSPGWEIVQLVGLQTLDLAILVRVQVSQPNLLNQLQKQNHLAFCLPLTRFSPLQWTSFEWAQKWVQWSELKKFWVVNSFNTKFQQIPKYRDRI
jgi:hypothetical protein